MTIKDYIEENPYFDIHMECELEFAEPDDEQEAKENIKWVLKNSPTFEALSVVMNSYYSNTIEW